MYKISVLFRYKATYYMAASAWNQMQESIAIAFAFAIAYFTALFFPCRIYSYLSATSWRSIHGHMRREEKRRV